MPDYKVLFTTPAYGLTVGDPVVLDGDLCVIRSMDDDREDVDEILFRVENLSDPAGETDFPVYADDEIEVWSYND